MVCHEEDGVYRDPADCTKYYKCHNGYPFILSTCPAGTEFSDELKICHWAALVGCSQDFQDVDYEYDEDSEAPGRFL